MSTARRVKTCRIAIVVAVLAIVAACWFVTKAVSTANDLMRAEERLHATIVASEVIGDYVESHASWPRSWEDLKSAPPRASGMYRWPDDRDALQRLVVIRFDVDPAAVAASTPDSFDAVRPNGHCTEFWRGYAAAPLIDRLRAGPGARPHTPGAPPG